MKQPIVHPESSESSNPNPMPEAPTFEVVLAVDAPPSAPLREALEEEWEELQRGGGGSAMRIFLTQNALVAYYTLAPMLATLRREMPRVLVGVGVLLLMLLLGGYAMIAEPVVKPPLEIAPAPEFEQYKPWVPVPVGPMPVDPPDAERVV